MDFTIYRLFFILFIISNIVLFSQNNDENEIFIYASLSKKEVFVYEAVEVTYKIYFKKLIPGANKLNLTKLPEFKDLYVTETFSNPSPDFKDELYKSERFKSAIIKKAYIFPLRTGSIEITPYILDIKTSKSIKDRSGIVESISKQISSDKLILKVNSLPDPPNSFRGAVGDFTMKVNLENDTVQINKLNNLIVKVSGRGNLKFLNDIPVKLPGGIRLMDKKNVEDVKGLSGSKTFIYSFMSVEDKEFTIEPIEFSFFNSKTKDYEVIKSDSLKIYFYNIDKKKESVHSQAENSSWWIDLVVIFIIIVLISFLYFKQKEKKKNPVYKEENAFIIVSKELKKTDDLDKIVNVFIEYLFNKKLIESLTFHNYMIINELNRKQHLKEDLIKSIEELFTLNNFIKYSPEGQRSKYDLKDFRLKVYSIINNIENIK